MAGFETDMGGQVLQMDFPNSVSVAFDTAAFDEQIRAHGVRFVHYRAMRDPVGLIDRYDARRPDDAHAGASNGMLYTQAGCLTALFTGNSKELKALEGGQLSAAYAQITPASTYEGGTERVYLAPLDRLFLEEAGVLVPHQQLVEAHETGDDRLRYPAARVLDLVDARGVRYTPDTDFCLHDGRVVWKTAKRPGVNTETQRGVVYAVRYLYRPHWYVDQLMHEVRVAQVEDPVTGQRGLVQMPQAARIAREFVFQNEDKDPLAPDPGSPRQVMGPRDGGMGPR